MLDLVNVDLGGDGNGRRRRTTPIATTGTRSVSARPVKDNSPEAKAVKAFFNAMNVLSFDPARFALIFSGADLAIQKRAIQTLLYLVDILASRWDNQTFFDEEERDFVIVAKRAQDAMRPFRENGML